MILEPTELAFVESALDTDRKILERLDGPEEDQVEEAQLPDFFGKFPHLILALDFDEYVVLEKPSATAGPDPFRDSAGHYGVDTTTLVYDTESIYRQSESGAWYIFDGLTEAGQFSNFEALHFVGPQTSLAFSVDEWIGKLATLTRNVDGKPRALWLPGRWTPTFQADQRRVLKETVDPLLEALQIGTTSLRDLHWREFEEVVAELLSRRGLQIEVTPRNRDGGRDVIARGELIPGEPMQIAIEVKQKPVVGLVDVQRALYANRSFPALMVATAGTFSAGVLHERDREENSMRLFLKDGAALRQWLVARDSSLDNLRS